MSLTDEFLIKSLFSQGLIETSTDDPNFIETIQSDDLIRIVIRFLNRRNSVQIYDLSGEVYNSIASKYAVCQDLVKRLIETGLTNSSVSVQTLLYPEATGSKILLSFLIENVHQESGSGEPVIEKSPLKLKLEEVLAKCLNEYVEEAPLQRYYRNYHDGTGKEASNMSRQKYSLPNTSLKTTSENARSNISIPERPMKSETESKSSLNTDDNQSGLLKHEQDTRTREENVSHNNKVLKEADDEIPSSNSEDQKKKNIHSELLEQVNIKTEEVEKLESSINSINMEYIDLENKIKQYETEKDQNAQEDKILDIQLKAEKLFFSTENKAELIQNAQRIMQKQKASLEKVTPEVELKREQMKSDIEKKKEQVKNTEHGRLKTTIHEIKSQIKNVKAQYHENCAKLDNCHKMLKASQNSDVEDPPNRQMFLDHIEYLNEKINNQKAEIGNVSQSLEESSKQLEDWKDLAKNTEQQMFRACKAYPPLMDKCEDILVHSNKCASLLQDSYTLKWKNRLIEDKLNELKRKKYEQRLQSIMEDLKIVNKQNKTLEAQLNLKSKA